MTRRTRHWIAAASVVAAAAAAGGFTVTATMNTPSPADATVTTVHGDTVKNPTAKNGWGDGTPVSTNIVLTGITASGVE